MKIENINKISIEKIFVILTLIFGCIFIYIIPPFQSPDEDSHFKKAYYIAGGDFYARTDGKIIGLEIPNSISDYIYEKQKMMGQRDKKYSYSELYLNQLLPSDYSVISLQQVSTSTTPVIAHIIPAMGIFASKILSKPIIDGSPSVPFMLYFARFFSLISYIIIGYFAIKITPAFKKSIFAVLTIPMSVFLGSMVSYDNLLLPVTALAAAIILKLIYDDKCKLNYKYMISLFILGYILYNIKKVYFPILVLLAFVPKEKFGKKTVKDKILTLGCLLLSIIIVSFIIEIPQPELSKGTEVSLSSKQIEFILHHPFKYLVILLENIKSQLPWQLYWMVGTFGLIDTYIPPLFMYLVLINILMVFITDGITEKIKINYKQKIVALGIIVIGLVLMYTAMYVYWTTQIYGNDAIGGNALTGVQGRYFLPLLISVPLIFSTKLFDKMKKCAKFSEEFFPKSLIMTIICLIVSVFVCLTRFWI